MACFLQWPSPSVAPLLPVPAPNGVLHFHMGSWSLICSSRFPPPNDLRAAMANLAAPGGLRLFLWAVSAVPGEARTPLRVVQMEGLAAPKIIKRY
ncbi:hypothetical protein Zm00014a_029300 [Zea mays]|uniref:Uncharacterized protein n=1 Tax=Zea mays TaxID=4577 RepID=A0A3L6EFI7_MAIZE|nr:hypothetical protein Zm00014a_029300 [Zea mays]